MIKHVTIEEFGPEGLCYALLEAPGSMCVMTAVGMPSEPVDFEAFLRKISGNHVPPKEPCPNARLIVIAGTRDQYLQYIRSRNLKDRKDAWYFSFNERIIGVSIARFVFTGSWTTRKDIDHVFEFVDMKRMHDPKTKVEYHPIFA